MWSFLIILNISDDKAHMGSKKYETSQYESSHSAWYETEHRFSFEVFDNLSKAYVSVEDLAVSHRIVTKFAYPLTEPDISPTFYEIIPGVNGIGCGHRIKGSNF